MYEINFPKSFLSEIEKLLQEEDITQESEECKNAEEWHEYVYYIAEKVNKYLQWNSSIRNAYFDCMH